MRPHGCWSNVSDLSTWKLNCYTLPLICFLLQVLSRRGLGGCIEWPRCHWGVCAWLASAFSWHYAPNASATALERDSKGLHGSRTELCQDGQDKGPPWRGKLLDWCLAGIEPSSTVRQNTFKGVNSSNQQQIVEATQIKGKVRRLSSRPVLLWKTDLWWPLIYYCVFSST